MRKLITSHRIAFEKEELEAIEARKLLFGEVVQQQKSTKKKAATKTIKKSYQEKKE